MVSKSEKPVHGIEKALTRIKPNTHALALGGVSMRRLRDWAKTDPAGALQKWVEHVGSQVALARILGVAQRTISVWIAADLPNRAPKPPANAVERAVQNAGGQPAMAEALGVTQQCVSNWCRQGYVPSSRAGEVAECYGVPHAELISPKLRAALPMGGVK